MDIIRKTLPQNLPALDLTFEDPRMEPLFFRYKARNYPGILSLEEQHRWVNHRREILTETNLKAYIEKINHLLAEYQHDAQRCLQLKALVDYAVEIAS